MPNNKLLLIITVIIFVTSFIGIFDMPYSYYMFKRVIVCGGMVLIAFNVKELNNNFFIFSLMMAALFNPFYPVGLTRFLWAIIDVVNIIFLIYLNIQYSSNNSLYYKD